jgi:hypothetical protein
MPATRFYRPRMVLRRMVPGGVALSKALSVAPDLGGGLMNLPGAMQRTYADYNNPLPDGRVPILSKDGRLVDFKSGTELVIKGLGVDLGTFNRGGELDGYLVKQREIILNYRREYLTALSANNVEKARAIAKEYGTRFKDPVTKRPLPLTVTNAQVQAFIASREVGRTERIMDRLPPDVRQQYTGFAAANARHMNVEPESLKEGTAGKRARAQSTGASRPSADGMLRAQRETGMPGSQKEQSLSPFQPFTSF